MRGSERTGRTVFNAVKPSARPLQVAGKLTPNAFPDILSMFKA
jgi:hypothetical protein